MRIRRPTLCAPRSRNPRHSGFTLVEASLTIIIIGLGVLASAELLATGTKANADSHRLTTGLNLATNVREYAQQKTGAQVLALHGVTYEPAHDARGEAIVGLEDWTQLIAVEKVSPDWVTTTVGVASTSRLLRLTVTVRHRGIDITTEEWLLADTSD